MSSTRHHCHNPNSFFSNPSCYIFERLLGQSLSLHSLRGIPQGNTYEVRELFLERYSLISSSFMFLRTPVLATPPVLAASSISFLYSSALPTVDFQYEMSAAFRQSLPSNSVRRLNIHFALTSMSFTRGSSGPPSCVPSPRSPNHALTDGL